MVNGWLKWPVIAADERPMAAMAPKSAHFRRESCVNQHGPMRLGPFRSHFGSNDSWSIN
jgi:hypothetical protein